MDVTLLESALNARGEPRYRAHQIWEWAARGAQGYADMTNVPAQLREELEGLVPFSTLRVVEEAHADDGTVKTLFSTHDGHTVEAVLMRYRDGRRSICVSSQSGCPLTCTFCATGAMKFGRNLTSWEMLDQVLHFRRVEPLNHCVFMGMGEPMLNIEEVLAACHRLPEIGIANRRTAVSTVGWVPGIERFTNDVTGPVKLALSLHAPNDELRTQLMPVNERYPLRDVLAACAAYHERRRRKVFVEYVMLAGVNDEPAHARALTALLDRTIYKVNLIPYNPTGVFEGSTPERIAAFKAVLDTGRLPSTARLTRGREIEAACGQLAARRRPQQQDTGSRTAST